MIRNFHLEILSTNKIGQISGAISMDQQYSILVVEDDYLQSYTLKMLLESLNHKVLGIVDSGEGAIEMAAKLEPDLILMDITLGKELDGIDAAIKIQEKSDASIIYITGNSSKYFRDKAELTNFLDYLLKPVTKRLLTDVLKKHFIKK